MQEEPVTKRIKDMREQDEYFRKLEKSPFKRVHLMAADIRRKIDMEYKEEVAARGERREINIMNRKQDSKSINGFKTWT